MKYENVDVHMYLCGFYGCFSDVGLSCVSLGVKNANVYICALAYYKYWLRIEWLGKDIWTCSIKCISMEMD